MSDPHRILGRIAAPGAILVGGLIGGGLGADSSASDTRLTFLSVGQGDCAVFQTEGHTVLIDAGPNTRGNDAGKKIVVPDLRRMGITSIDLILLSHPDTDHIGGLGALLKSFTVGKVAVSSWFKSDVEFLRNLSGMGCGPERVLWLGPDQSARVGAFTLEVDCPEWHPGEPDNDGSEFVRVAAGRAAAVFTGDASEDAEARMLPGHDWSAQVLKLGHHGSRTASGEPWLRAVHPAWAIVSCGRDNEYGHPHRAVVDRVQRLGIRLARTDMEGDVTFTFGPSGWERRR